MKLLSVLLMSFVCSLIISCHSKPDSKVEHKAQSGIMGGQQANSSSPALGSTVSLLTGTFKPATFCSGTLISKNLVLTATHCLKDISGRKLSVFFGETLPSGFENSNIVAVKSYKVHPGYKNELSPITNTETGYNDIGLIVLDGALPNMAKPVPVLNDSVIPDGTSLLLAGYGYIQDTPDYVKAVGLSYVNVKVSKVFENIIVTDQTAGNGACAGDSGGPAYMETSNGLVVLGITRGPHASAPDCHHYGEYTYASRFKDYILNSADELGAERPEFVDAPTSF